MAQLFQPTNITPDMRGPLGNGFVAYNPMLQENYFHVSWQVNGNTPMTAYRVKFYTNDGNHTEVYDSQKLTTGCPFYGTDQNGNPVLFEADFVFYGYDLNETGQMVITQWWGSGPDDYVVQVSPSIFLVKEYPSNAIYYNNSSVPATISTKSVSFTGEFTGLGGSGMIWTRWILTGPNGETIKDTGKIYGNAEVSFSYDGLLPNNAGETYKITLSGESDYGETASTYREFSVSYTLQEITAEITAGRACNGESAVQVVWPQILSIPLVSHSGTYAMTSTEITLGNNASLLWNQVNGESMSFSASWTFLWSGKVPTIYSGNLFTLSFPNMAQMTVSYSTSNLGNNRLTVSILSMGGGQSYALDMEDYLVRDTPLYIAVAPSGIYVYYQKNIPGDALYPNNYLYPSNTLYPRDTGTPSSSVFLCYVDTRNKNFWNASNVVSIALGGAPTTVYYAKLLSISMSSDSFVEMAESGDAPVFDSDTLYLLAPNASESYNAGNFHTLSPGSMTGLALYRKDGDNTWLTFLSSFDLDASGFLDYSAKSQQGPYSYYLYVNGSSAYQSEPAISEAVSPCFWNWSLLECTQDSDGNFEVQASYLFAANITSGSISNNNRPNVLGNFTKYPLVQLSQQNYKSGTLAALIGSVDYTDGQNTYSDSLSLKEAIYNLSTTSNFLFLKNRKGDLWMVRTSGDIQMETMDNTSAQAQTVRFPWVEVGDADGASIYKVLI